MNFKAKPLQKSAVLWVSLFLMCAFLQKGASFQVQNQVQNSELKKDEFKEVFSTCHSPFQTYFFKKISTYVAPLQAEEASLLFFQLTEKFNLNPAFVLAIIEKESHFNPRAVSNKGALGLMQLLPETAKENLHQNLLTIDEELLLNPLLNLKSGFRFLSQLFKQFDSNLPIVLAAYHSGPYRALQFVKGLKDPPESTKIYIDAVMKRAMQLENLSHEHCVSSAKNTLLNERTKI